jgi:hypothetical protein
MIPNPIPRNLWQHGEQSDAREIVYSIDNIDIATEFQARRTVKVAESPTRSDLAKLRRLLYQWELD